MKELIYVNGLLVDQYEAWWERRQLPDPEWRNKTNPVDGLYISSSIQDVDRCEALFFSDEGRYLSRFQIDKDSAIKDGQDGTWFKIVEI